MSDKKHKIISVAAELIHSKGYEATKIRDIMAAADIGKGQFYHYFSSKKELGLAVIEHFVFTWENELIHGILGSDKSSEKKLKEMLEWAVDYHENLPNMFGCPFGNLALEMSEHDEEFRKRINNLFHQWIHCLEGVIKELSGEQRALQKAQSLVAQIEGGILLMKNYQDIAILKEIIESIQLQYLEKPKGV
ncbi:TetR/AcrR family transcriptional regulator [Alteribacillus sp. JSM 102045]|uniref:TetR/AcrR family transcriptional regulator n=1 Tax=Alteribacillus sp. JSM 102045 TaxID=1562101 RepID=UPI0035BEE251